MNSNQDSGRNRNRFQALAMPVVFDIAGPLVAYQLLRSAGQSAVSALVLSGVFPALASWPAGTALRPLDFRR